MFRFFGFVMGSVVAIGAMLLLLGVPKLKLAGPLVDAREPGPLMTEAAEPLTTEAIEPATEPEPRFVELSPAAESAASGNPVEIPVLDPGPAQEDVQWHAFWNPFRSELAANGFVSRLERVTGLDYRIVKMKPGAYQVAFAYVDDSERVTKLAQIEAATGLNLPETRP
jgi:hypothetical protein